MIKFTLNRDDGATIIGLGLVEENVTRMRDGKPVLVKLRDMGFTQDLQFMIFLGKDERELHEKLKPFIGPDTVVNIDPRLKDA